MFAPLRRLALLALAALSLTAHGAAAEQHALRISVLQFGTVNWELDVIERRGLDAAEGFDLQVSGVAGSAAAKIAFEGGEADAIVSDWIWVARQRAAGRDYVFIPYSTAVGGLMVPADSAATGMADLAGGTIGIAGGPLDKSWLILQAYAAQQGFDLAGETDQAFGAPPLIFQKARSGEFAGAINFWHFTAKMEASGMRRLVSVGDAAEALGLDPATPLLGYVVKGAFARERPDVVAGLAAASRAAKEILATDDAEWDALRARMKPANDAEFAALKAGFIAGIPAAGPVDQAAAARMLALMAELGGEKLVGGATEMPDGVFYAPGS